MSIWTGLFTEVICSAGQQKLLKQVMQEMSTAAKHKEELFPGSAYYISSNRLAALKSQESKSPAMYGVGICLALVGNHQTALQIFNGGSLGLRAAFGDEFVANITGTVQHVSVQHV